VTSSRRLIVASLAVAFVVRLAFGLLYWTHQPLTHDEREYLALARSLARGTGFTYPPDEPAPGTGQRFGRAPGYPLFLAAIGVRDPVDTVPARVKIAQSLVGTGGVWLIALLASRAAGPRAGAAAAVIAALYPPLVFIPAYAFSEVVFSTVALLAAWVLTLTVDARERTQAMLLAAASGALTAAAILIRPALLFFVPLAIGWLVIRETRGGGPARAGDHGGPAEAGHYGDQVGARRTWMPAIVFAATLVIGIAPWTARNARVYGRFILVASEGGVTFWTGNHPLAVGDGDLAANPALKVAELEFRRAHADLTPEQLEPLYYRSALDWVRYDPGAWLTLEARKLFYTIVPLGPSYKLHSAPYFAASAIPYVALLGPAAAGAWMLRRRSRAPMALWLMALSTVIAGLVFFPQERFRIPVIDPALIVAAATLAADGRKRMSHAEC
jgi:hypothetical protein